MDFISEIDANCRLDPSLSLHKLRILNQLEICHATLLRMYFSFSIIIRIYWSMLSELGQAQGVVLILNEHISSL